MTHTKSQGAGCADYPAVASRDGGLLAYDSGEVYEPGGRVPASRLFNDDDLAERPVKTCVDALADLHQTFFAHAGGDHAGGRASGCPLRAERMHRRGGEHGEAGVVHSHHSRRGRSTCASEVS